MTTSNFWGEEETCRRRVLGFCLLLQGLMHLAFGSAIERCWKIAFSSHCFQWHWLKTPECLVLQQGTRRCWMGTVWAMPTCVTVTQQGVQREILHPCWQGSAAGEGLARRSGIVWVHIAPAWAGNCCPWERLPRDLTWGIVLSACGFAPKKSWSIKPVLKPSWSYVCFRASVALAGCPGI